jgi:hypothetical protein
VALQARKTQTAYTIFMSKKHRTNNKYAVALLILSAGILIGYFANSLTQTKNPKAQEIEHAKNEIAKLFAGKTVPACWTVNKGPNLGVGRYELNYRNLRINSELNRAIVTDCGENDTLLYKNKAGQWKATTVNLQLGNRVSPTWQGACKIKDITIADDQVRPENNTIDSMNFHECMQINQQ